MKKQPDTLVQADVHLSSPQVQIEARLGDMAVTLRRLGDDMHDLAREVEKIARHIGATARKTAVQEAKRKS